MLSKSKNGENVKNLFKHPSLVNYRKHNPHKNLKSNNKLKTKNEEKEREILKPLKT